MEMRDAIEADAGRLASLTDAPRDVMRNLVHDRTVRVIEDEGDIRGFVSYDAREQTVYVTQLEGDDDDVYAELLAEPVRFAQTEQMAVELLVPETESGIREAASAAGFRQTGGGPRFDGESTTRYRIDDP
jgi:hypothetical protein